jgi:hypothetical protein
MAHKRDCSNTVADAVSGVSANKCTFVYFPINVKKYSSADEKDKGKKEKYTVFLVT